MTETPNYALQELRKISRNPRFNFSFKVDKGKSIFPMISSVKRKETVNMTIDLSDNTLDLPKNKCRQHDSIDFDRDSAISKISMRNRLLSCKISKLNNYWNKKCSDEKKSKPVKATRKILMFKKVHDPENKNKMKMVTQYMSPEKAALFKQLFRKFIE